MSRTDTFDLIFERVVAWGQDDQVASRYPNGVHFVAADHPDHGEMTGNALAEGAPVILVFPDGNELLIQAGENAAVQVEARDSGGHPLAA
jgi:hypothetical protein